jgi:hypothetical protein
MMKTMTKILKWTGTVLLALIITGVTIYIFTSGGLRLESDLYQQVADELSALGYLPEEDPVWDKDFGAVGAIMLGSDGSLYAGSDPRDETTVGGK